MRGGIFITGTDTGVGKTYVALLLLKLLLRKGTSAGVMKPVETGCAKSGDHLIPEDAEKLRIGSLVSDPLDLINPYRFEAPLAPSEAARQEGIQIDLARLRQSFDILRLRHPLLLVEGAGGLLVPLIGGYTFADLARDWGLSLLLVIGSRLGAINQTLLTLEVARYRGLKMLGVILNHPAPPDKAAHTNPQVLRSLMPEPLLGVVGYGQEEAELDLTPLLEE
ncbi:MAG: dethiobiotin synthase [Candidatus Tectomicrobia bacterium]|uniref:ATP-dependent dethiobiotin synthetase BioD n=1 Tax=Tectimicrobiota bacterium TaxID=2528274 RepID=A0A932GR19_UNCTE|nr:dethiobiotin synthase [Candidatus Tectomicrobia bacterium]